MRRGPEKLNFARRMQYITAPKRLFATRMTPFTPPMAAFAFDIDGVLTQGSNALPQAKRILNYLSGYNPWKLNFPFVLITNGGGKPERDRCTELSNLLETKIDEDMFMQSHTVVGSRVLPYLDQYQTKPILVLGGAGDTCRLIAQDYGFRDVLIPADVFCWNKDIWPLHTPTQEEQQIARKDFDFSEKPIAAAFVFHDPRNWAPDVQILLDIVRYGSQTLPAFVGRRGDRGQHHSTEGDKRVELVFCNPDLVWRGAYPEPRLGQGGFRYAFQSIHTALEGKPYNATILGKPSTETYRHAENMIMNLSSRAYGTNIPKSSIFMIGDNPDSDIAGANKAGWNSVLVHTGVFSPGEQTPSHIPTFQARDVEEAVHLALQRVSGQELPLP